MQAEAISVPGNREWGFEVCESAYRDVEGVELVFTRDGYPRHPIIQFTNGVLKLPKGYWVTVAETLHEGRWRRAKKPLAYIRLVAARKMKTLKWEMSRGSYAGDGKRPIYQTVPIAAHTWSECRTLAENGVWLDAPHCKPAPTSERILMREIIPLSPIMSTAAVPEGEEHRDYDNPSPTMFDEWGYWNWVNFVLASQREIDWYGIAETLQLDEDEWALFSAALFASEDADLRKLLRWDYNRFDKTRKRLRRKRSALKSAINEQAQKKIAQASGSRS
jgi:hypothetical protein